MPPLGDMTVMKALEDEWYAVVNSYKFT